MHQLPVRIYYEDTDMAGVVYYANYLRFLERGRSEYLRSFGIVQSLLMSKDIAFAVRSVQLEYLAAARLDNLLHVQTEITQARRAQLWFSQRILRNDQLLLDAKVRIVCIQPSRMRAAPIPLDLFQLIEKANHD